MGDEIQVITRSTEDGVTDEIFFEGFGDGAVSTVPSALTRWAEEGQILDPQGVHHCVAAVKPEIVPVLLKHQAEEIAKGREEEQKKRAEAAAKKEEEKKKQGSKASGSTQSETGGEESATTQADVSEEGSAAQSSEGMQVEGQVEAASNSLPSVPVEPSSEATAVLVSMSMDEPVTDLASSSNSSTVRTSTPVNEDHSATSIAAPASTLAQEVISAATVEAAGATTSEETVESTPSSNRASSDELQTSEQEGDGSPMALGEEGSVTPRPEDEQPIPPGLASGGEGSVTEGIFLFPVLTLWVVSGR